MCRWVLFVIYGAVILAAAPYGRVFQTEISSRFSGSGFFVVGAVGLGAFWWLSRRHAQGSPTAQLAATAYLVCAYAVGAYILRKRPEECLHLVEYGILAQLAYFAVRGTPTSPLCSSITAFGLSTSVGCVDELLQWLLPGRFFDYRDISINSLAAALQLGYLAILSPSDLPGSESPTDRREWFQSLVSLQLAVALLLLVAMLTRSAVFALSRLHPSLQFISAEIPTEHGCSRAFGAVRFTTRICDKTRPATVLAPGEVQALMHDITTNYESVLARFSSAGDDYRYESAVHLFRYLQYEKLDPALHIPGDDYPAGVIAAGEKAVLRHSFAAVASLLPDQTTHSAELDYVSPVSRELITRLSHPQLVALWSSILVLLETVKRLLKRSAPAALNARSAPNTQAAPNAQTKTKVRK